jgi:hypothetical protein
LKKEKVPGIVPLGRFGSTARAAETACTSSRAGCNRLPTLTLLEREPERTIPILSAMRDDERRGTSGFRDCPGSLPAELSPIGKKSPITFRRSSAAAGRTLRS